MDSMELPRESSQARELLRACVRNFDEIEVLLGQGCIPSADRLLWDSHRKLRQANGLLAKQHPVLLRIVP